MQNPSRSCKNSARTKCSWQTNYLLSGYQPVSQVVLPVAVNEHQVRLSSDRCIRQRRSLKSIIKGKRLCCFASDVKKKHKTRKSCHCSLSPGVKRQKHPLCNHKLLQSWPPQQEKSLKVVQVRLTNIKLVFRRGCIWVNIHSLLHMSTVAPPLSCTPTTPPTSKLVFPHSASPGPSH